MVILMLLWACGEPDEPSDADVLSEEGLPTADTAGAPVVRPALASPAEAEDLDPDPEVLHVALVASPHTLSVGGEAVEGWAYNGQVPGPTLRAKVGDTLVVDLKNELPDPTTIHWHGVRVPWAMDGVTWMQSPVAPGASFTYSFELTQAGTFWYHPHFDTARQVDLGLYGVLVVEDPAEPEVALDLVLVLDAWSEVEAGEVDPHEDPTPSLWTVNGLVDPVLSVASGSTVRARLLNASNTGYLDLQDERQIASDQGLRVVQGEVVLAPGDRAELEWSVGVGRDLMTLPFTVAGGAALGGPTRLLSLEGSGGAAAPAPVSWPYAPEAPSSDPGHTDVRWTFTGSAAQGWEINGETFPDVSPEVLALGAEAILEIRNVSPARHPFHLHGHSFEVLSVDGVPPAIKTIEDTVDVGTRQTMRLRLLADNPGDWMAHCHILPHAEKGMMTVLTVE